MKNLLLLAAGLMFAAMTASAMSLEEAAQILKLDNEQIVARIPEDVAAAAVVADLQKGAVVSGERLAVAESYCTGALADIDTKKKRKSVLRQMTAPVDSDLESWAWQGGSADRYFEARQISARIWRKLGTFNLEVQH